MHIFKCSNAACNVGRNAYWWRTWYSICWHQCLELLGLVGRQLYVSATRKKLLLNHLLREITPNHANSDSQTTSVDLRGNYIHHLTEVVNLCDTGALIEDEYKICCIWLTSISTVLYEIYSPVSNSVKSHWNNNARWTMDYQSISLDTNSTWFKSGLYSCRKQMSVPVLLIISVTPFVVNWAIVHHSNHWRASWGDFLQETFRGTLSVRF